MTDHIDPSAIPQEVLQPELFANVGSFELVSPELVDAKNISDDVQAMLEGMRAKKAAVPPTLSERRDELRRKRVAQERQEYLAANPEPTTQASTPEQVDINVTPVDSAIQGKLDLGLDITPEKPEGKRVAFGRYLKRWQYDMLGGHNITYLTESEKKWMTPSRIARELFVQQKRGQNYPDGLYVDGILLNQYEYSLIPRSPEALGKASLSKTIGDNDVSQEVVKRAERSRVHTFESKLEALSDHGEKLKLRKDDIIKLQRAAAKPGYSTQTAEDMKQLIAGAWNEFTNILDVLQIKRSWTQEQRDVAGGALLNFLTQGSQNNRVRNWRTMLELSRSYLAARTNIIDNRIKTTQALLATYTK